MGSHIDEMILAKCTINSCTLHPQVVWSQKLHEVAHMTSLTNPLCAASPAWWSFTSAQDGERLDRMVGRMKRWGFLPEDEPALATLVLNADQRLFKSIHVNPCHVLQIQLPDVENTGYNLCCWIRTTAILFQDSYIVTS